MLLIPPSAAVEVGTAPSTAAGGVHHPAEAARGRRSAGEDSDVTRRRPCPRHVEVALSLVSTKEKYTSIINVLIQQRGQCLSCYMLLYYKYY